MIKGIAAVTGASGIIGRKIKQKLLQQGYAVRILTRNKLLHDDNAQVYYGDIEDIDTLKVFLKDVSYLFHCAAELNNDSKMWDINVLGTERILNLIPNTKITYFCYLSSAGVIGLTDDHIVNENTKCNPQNNYEKSKWAAEKLVSNSIGSCSMVILRPTDVIDDQKPGALALPLRDNFLDRLLVFLKGNEYAHIIHAEDVADAAIYFIKSRFERPGIFFVSCDHEPFNTFGNLYVLLKLIQQGLPVERMRGKIYLPIAVPYILRRLRRGPCNYENIHYSSAKLLSTGFNYCLGVEGAVRSIVAAVQQL